MTVDYSWGAKNLEYAATPNPPIKANQRLLDGNDQDDCLIWFFIDNA